MRSKVPVSPVSAARDVSSRPNRHQVNVLTFPRMSLEESETLKLIALKLHSVTGEIPLVVEIGDYAVSEKVASIAELREGTALATVLEDLGGWKRLQLRLGEIDPGEFAEFASVLKEYFPYILIAGPMAELSALKFANAEIVFHFTNGSARELLEIRVNNGGKRQRRLVVTPPKGMAFPDFDWLEEKSGVRRDAIHNGGRPDGEIGHIARMIAGARIGLALSSGSAKGLAHIGVIEVLEKAGIEVDVVVGTSMGAYVGSCWCFGHTVNGLKELAGEMKNRGDIWKLIDPVLPPRKGFIRGNKIRKRLSRSIGGIRFEDMHRAFYAVATRLDTLEKCVFDRGDVATAVHASLAMPGVCEPVIIGGVSHTDGATSCPMPVRVLEEMGIERIIAVNALPSLADLRARAAEPVDLKSGLGARIARFLNRHLNYFASGNLLDTVMQGLQSGQVRLAGNACRRADVCIHVHPEGARWFHFDHHEEYINAGRAAALRHLEALKALNTVSR